MTSIRQQTLFVECALVLALVRVGIVTGELRATLAVAGLQLTASVGRRASSGRPSLLPARRRDCAHKHTRVKTCAQFVDVARACVLLRDIYVKLFVG